MTTTSEAGESSLHWPLSSQAWTVNVYGFSSLSSFAMLTVAVDAMGGDHAPRSEVEGSIRAVKQCLSCHSVERGELLGVFSYALRRELPLP